MQRIASSLLAASCLIALANCAFALPRFFRNEPYVPVDMTGGGDVAAADLNGDGRPDLVRTYPNGTSVLVRLALGNDLYAPEVSYPVGNFPLSIAAGDVDGDDLPDVVVANRDGASISVLHGNGDGTLAPHTTLPCGSTPQRVRLIDLDGDGLLDILVPCIGSNFVTYYRSLGPGFAPQVDIATGDQAADVAVGHLDADAIPDLAVACYGTQSPVWCIVRGLPGGGFALPIQIPLMHYPNAIAVGDLENDGDDDILVANYTNAADDFDLVSVIRSNGHGGFGNETYRGIGTHAQDVVAIDLDGDDRPEILASSAPGLVVLRGSDDYAPAGQRNFPVGRLPRTISLVDLDVDGKLDAVLATNQGYVSTVYGLGGGAFGRSTPVSAPPSTSLFGPHAVALGDFDGDGALDLVSSSTDALQSWIHPGIGDGTFGAGTFLSEGIASPTSIDVDHDGELDIAGHASPLAVRLGNGDGTFDPRLTSPAAGPAGVPAFGDLNGDPYPDVVFRGASGTVKVALALGDGTFTAGMVVGTIPPPSNFARLCAFADVDVDGDLDVLASDFAGRIYEAKNDGTGSFAPLSLSFIPHRQAEMFVVGRFDADAIPDLMIPNLWNELEFHRGVGDGTFVQQTLSPTHSGDGNMRVADLDGDGHLDFVFTNQFENAISVALGNGLGGISEEQRYGTPASPEGLAIGDLNDDGRPDIVVACYEARVSLPLINTLPPTAVSVDPPTGADVDGSFALHGARPHPAIGSELRVAFALASDARATLELFDVSGRLVAAREVGALGPGEHSVDLGREARVSSGIYVVRLRQGTLARTARVAVVR
jgi:hypothetical protein